MDNPRAEKVAVVDEVRQRLSGADAALLTEYRGIKVQDLAQLRRNLHPTGTEYKIYKNSLVRFAAQDLGLGALESLLEGPIAIAFVKGDAAAAAKALRDFSRTNPLLVVKGGVLGEKVIGAGEAAALAELPSRDVLLARFAGGLAAPLQQLAGLLQALPRNLAYGLKALAEQKAAAEGSPSPEGSPAPEASPVSESSADPESSPSPEASPAPESSADPESSPSPEASPAPE